MVYPKGKKQSEAEVLRRTISVRKNYISKKTRELQKAENRLAVLEGRAVPLERASYSQVNVPYKIVDGKGKDAITIGGKVIPLPDIVLGKMVDGVVVWDEDAPVREHVKPHFAPLSHSDFVE